MASAACFAGSYGQGPSLHRDITRELPIVKLNRIPDGRYTGGESFIRETPMSSAGLQPDFDHPSLDHRRASDFNIFRS